MQATITRRAHTWDYKKKRDRAEQYNALGVSSPFRSYPDFTINMCDMIFRMYKGVTGSAGLGRFGTTRLTTECTVK